MVFSEDFKSVRVFAENFGFRTIASYIRSDENWQFRRDTVPTTDVEEAIVLHSDKVCCLRASTRQQRVLYNVVVRDEWNQLGLARACINAHGHEQVLTGAADPDRPITLIRPKVS